MLQLKRSKMSLAAKMTNTTDFSKEIPLSLKTVREGLGLEPTTRLIFSALNVISKSKILEI